MPEKKEKTSLTIKLDCSYGLRRLKDGKLEEFNRKFTKGEKLIINKSLNEPFKDNKISPDMADLIIRNKQGG